MFECIGKGSGTAFQMGQVPRNCGLGFTVEWQVNLASWRLLSVEPKSHVVACVHIQAVATHAVSGQTR